MEVSVIGKAATASPSAQWLGLAVQTHGAIALSRVSCKSRTIRRRRRRTRRRTSRGDDDDEFGGAADNGNPWYYVEQGGAENFSYFLNPSCGGPTDGGGFGFNGGKGGGGWNSDWFSGHDWEDSSPPERGSGFATSFFHEVVCWIALSNCLHFAIKKVMRTVA